ncbi:MAG: hypothetical protein IIU96_05285 [Paludibacteraceae bacterium]|nr:hypothetical protein [Paludibacteraceae bacterium]
MTVLHLSYSCLTDRYGILYLPQDFRQTRIALLRADTKAEVFQIMDDIVGRWGEN